MKSQNRAWQGSIRLPRHRLLYYRKRAVEEGWQLSEFVRMLICLGATIYLLRLRNPEALEGFMRLATLSRASRALDMAVGRRSGRRKEPKHIGRTTLLPVHMPRGLYDLISTCSATTGRSRNSLLNQFLETGYILYMLGQNTLLKTLRSLEERAPFQPRG